MGQKLNVKDIIELEGQLKTYYQRFHNQCAEEDKYYNLEFAVPVVKGFVAYRRPTARNFIDDAASRVNTRNIDIRFNPRKQTQDAIAQSELLRKGMIGCWHRIQVEQGPVLPHQAKHACLYGVSIRKDMYAPHLWLNSPKPDDFKTQKAYEKAMGDWQERYNVPFPIVTQNINPQNILLDPSPVNRNHAIEKKKFKVLDVRARLSRNPLYKSDWRPKSVDYSDGNAEVEWWEYWDDEYMAIVVDKEILLPATKHNYGFFPYVICDAGLGYLSDDASPEQRWRGLAHPLHGVFDLGSRIFSEYEAVLQRYAWPSEDWYGDRAQVLQARAKHEPGPGTSNYIGEIGAVERRVLEGIGPPTELLQLLAMVDRDVEKTGVRDVGLGGAIPGARSARQMQAHASLSTHKLNSITDSLAEGVAKSNEHFLQFIENVVPGPITVWAKTPSEPAFDQVIRASDIKGYYSNHVRLTHLSPEEEQQRTFMGIHLYQIKLISAHTALEKYVGIENPTEEQVKIFKELALKSPPVLNYMVKQALIALGMEEELAVMESQQAEQAGAMGQSIGTQGMAELMYGRENEPQGGVEGMEAGVI